jgi:hypothetical protein
MVPLAAKFRDDVACLRGLPLLGEEGCETKNLPLKKQVAQDAHLDALAGQVVKDSAAKRRRHGHRVFSQEMYVVVSSNNS